MVSLTPFVVEGHFFGRVLYTGLYRLASGRLTFSRNLCYTPFDESENGNSDEPGTLLHEPDRGRRERFLIGVRLLTSKLYA